MPKLLNKYLKDGVNIHTLNEYNKVLRCYKKYRKSLDYADKSVIKSKLDSFSMQFRSDPADLPF